MLPYKNRLIKRSDFASIYKGGAFFSAGNVTIKYRKNGLGETRIGVAVGLKFSKKAVERNRIKRQIREIFRDKIKDIKPGWDIVVMGRRREGENVEFTKLKELVEEVLRRSNLIKNYKSQISNSK